MKAAPQKKKNREHKKTKRIKKTKVHQKKQQLVFTTGCCLTLFNMN